MTAPNIMNLSSATGKSYFANLTSTANATLLTTGANQLYKINSITIINLDGTTGYDATMYVANATVTVPVAYQITVPAKSSLVLTDKSAPIYLEENYQLQGGTSANSKLSVLVNYEILQ